MEPNMTAEGMRRWRQSEAYAEYRRYRDDKKYRGYTDYVARRALQVIRGRASEEIRQKVSSYIERHTEQEAGERRFGSGADAVSAHTAALRNWGYDPTGRYA